ncbi:MAG: protein TolA, partial [Methylotenera sp.]
MHRSTQSTMLRTYEKEVSWKAGVLAVAVHLALLGALLISFNWKAAHPVLNVAEVELWDSLPSNAPPPPPPVIEPIVKAEPPPPVVKEEPKPEPVAEPKIEEPKVDIALEKKKELEQKKAEEKAAKIAEDKRKKEQLAALQAESRQEEMRDKEKQVKDKKAKDELKKLQQEINTDGEQQALSAKASANAGVIDEYKRKI